MIGGKMSSRAAAALKPAPLSAPEGDPAELRAEHVRGAKLFANRHDMLRSLRGKLRGKNIAEIGVAHGEFSNFILSEIRPARFDAYDVFKMHEWASAWGKDPAELLDGKRHLEFYRDRFRDHIARGEVRVFEGDGATNMASSDIIYDMIYIDGDHTLDAVRRDAQASITRLKSRGYLIFNDYISYDHRHHETYGIVEVVNDLCVNHGWRITHMGLHHRMFADVVLRKS